MRVAAIISAIACLTLVLLCAASELALIPTVGVRMTGWRWSFLIALCAWFTGWAWHRSRITDLDHEVEALKQEVRDVCKVARAAAGLAASAGYHGTEPKE